MKRIDTLVQATRWEEVSRSVSRFNLPATLREVKTVGRRPLRREVYRGTPYYSNVSNELELTLIVDEAQLEQVVSELRPFVESGEFFISTVDVLITRLEHSIAQGVTASSAVIPAGSPAPARQSWAAVAAE